MSRAYVGHYGMATTPVAGDRQIVAVVRLGWLDPARQLCVEVSRVSLNTLPVNCHWTCVLQQGMLLSKVKDENCGK